MWRQFDAHGRRGLETLAEVVHQRLVPTQRKLLGADVERRQLLLFAADVVGLDRLPRLLPRDGESEAEVVGQARLADQVDLALLVQDAGDGPIGPAHFHQVPIVFQFERLLGIGGRQGRQRFGRQFGKRSEDGPHVVDAEHGVRGLVRVIDGFQVNGLPPIARAVENGRHEGRGVGGPDAVEFPAVWPG